MNALIMNILTAFIVALIGVITTYTIPFLKARKDEATAKLRQTKWCWAADIIDAVVRAVEQTVAGELHGIDKKNLALCYIQPFLRNAGIDLSEDEIDKLIEAAVQAINAGIISVDVEDKDEA